MKQKIRIVEILIVIIFTIIVLNGCKSDMENIGSSNNSILLNSNKKNEYSENLCKDTEKILFSFKTEKTNKIMSLCVSNNQPDYIIYRFGTKENIELEYPNNINESWGQFTYSYYLRGGGKENAGLDLNYLTFAKDNYEYKIYQEYDAEKDLTNVGIRIKDKDNSREVEITGQANTVIGNLLELRENRKIKIETM